MSFLRKPKTNKLVLNAAERDAMRCAGKFNAQLLDFIRPHVKAGVQTKEIDRLVYDYTVQHGHVPAQLGYQGFPASTCISVNDVICHGIPGDYVFQEGDIANIDVTTIVDGWFGDSSETFLIGRVSEAARRVVQCSFDSLYAAIRAIGPGSTVADIGRPIVAEAKKYGFSVVQEFVGHGLGRQMHLEPSITHYPTRAGAKIILEPGMCFTIEPMINTGTRYAVVDRNDGWTVRTRDGGLSAQFEHTILMTETGPEILTPTEHGPRAGFSFL